MDQLMTFTKLEHIDLFGLNVWRHTKEPSEKKRRSFLLGTYIFVAVIFAGYLGGSAYGMAMMGLADKIPMVWSFAISVLTVGFGMFKAGSLLYRERDLNLLASLPVKPLPIVTARLIRFYTGNLVIAILGMIPTFLISGIMGGAGVQFYLNMILAILIVPILPTAVSAWFGIATSAIVARNRHKVLTETIIVLIVTVGSLLLPIILTGGKVTTANVSFNAGASSTEAMEQLGAQVSDAFADLENNAPFLKTWCAMFLGRDIPALAVYGLISFAILVITALIIGRNFFGITAMLYATSGHREFKLEQMQKSSVIRALVNKEAKRYFACGIYVSNTIVGPVMGVVFAIVLAFFDMNELLSSADLSGLPFELNLNACIPFVVAMTFSIATIAASSISMEGKNRWILQSLPVASEDLMKAKLLFNLIFVAPFYALAELIMLFTVHAGFMERICIILIPAVFAVFAICLGLFCNIRFPNFNWETEVQVVKQSAAVGISMIGALVPMIAAAGIMIVPRDMTNLATFAVVAVVTGVTILLYRKDIKSAL